MAPKSPTHAFDPTPALEQNKENYSPLNFEQTTEPSNYHHGIDKPTKEVHFSSFPSVVAPPRRAQSIATHHNIPLLDPISSASHVPRHSVQLKNGVQGVDMQAYMEHSRSVIERQREAFSQEKASFEQERKMWNAERNMLKARIADLESRLSGSKDGRRRYSNDSSVITANSFRADFGNFSSVNSVNISRTLSQTYTSPPVWESPETTVPVTRVFSNEEQKNAGHLPSISEDEVMPELSKEISPNTNPLARPAESVPIPIQEVDPKLDGITIKSAALAPSFRVLTPTFVRSPAQSPSPRGKLPDPSEYSLQLDTQGLLSPLDEKLKRHAGHTPMNFGNGSANGSSSITTEQATPKQEKPPAPVPTARPSLRPSECSDSYFSFTSQSKEDTEKAETEFSTNKGLDNKHEAVFDPSPDEDKPLRGPLMLDPSNKTNNSHVFLDKLDQKLHEVEEIQRTDTRRSDGTDRSDTMSHSEKDFEGPRLKIKNSMNFGSAFGSNKPGCS